MLAASYSLDSTVNRVTAKVYRNSKINKLEAGNGTKLA